jgi:hypothetical protein
VVIEWDAPGPTVDRVRVERRDRETRSVQILSDGAPGDRRAVDRRVQPGVEYEYALRAVDQYGNAAEPAGWRRVRIPEAGR